MADIAKYNGIAIADIAKLNGVDAPVWVSEWLKTNLTSYWELQTSSADSHWSNHGSDNNMSYSSSAVFNWTNAYITFWDIDFTGDCSFVCWATWTATGIRVIVDKFTTTNPLRIAQNSSTRIYTQIYDWSTTNTATATSALNNWAYHMLTFVRDDTAWTLYLYVDGSSTVYSASDTIAADLTNNVNLTMWATATLAAWFAGNVKYAGLWSWEALSTTKIDALYNSGTPRTYASLT